MAEDIGSVVIYHAEHRPTNFDFLIFGVDVGTRNLGVCAIGAGDHGQAPLLLGLYHEDLGHASNTDEDVLLIRLRTRLENIFKRFDYLFALSVFKSMQLAIETQEKQRGDCQMAQIAGMIKMCFSTYWSRIVPFCSVYSSSASACSSLAVQRLCLKEDECFAVSKTDEKKPRVVAMVIGLLTKLGLNAALVTYQHKLCRFTAKGDPIKTSDRRDHTGDALGHALKAYLERMAAISPRKRKREE